ncbi:O-antigen ligase family protein [Marinobacter sp. AL4B]|uniref:O-antigen ligase family protein n=1 Tax=Marinobacter sp. AL4B TaxID=2871173 RepID=UPI001CAA6FCD|nr:O-antigen ligase family protein [Marinobacter sp. AL4B]MBZ0333686.1 O-antigen ligase family protein [Marinobacter sp. AL4B]
MDLILVSIICFLIFLNRSRLKSNFDDSSRYLFYILCFSIVTLPLVHWPGSVINNGIVLFIKGAIFYFFTVSLVVSEKRLKLTVFVFVLCNLMRVIEPLVLNITSGYLGSSTYLGGGEFAGRLSGAPSDVVNPNGLAFIIATVIPFLHYVMAPINRFMFSVYIILMPVLLYTMALTLSRSGIIALCIIALGVWIKSSHKFMLVVVGIFSVFIIYVNLNDVQKDRYFSIVSDEAQQSGTAHGRIDGWFVDLKVAMNRPLIGHGLGTSREANWNVAGIDRVSHILWAEVWQEIGVIGLFLFIFYLKSMVKNFLQAGCLVKKNLYRSDFVYRCLEAMQVWLLMNFLFSFASYGLKSYEWYFFGGLSVVILSIVKNKICVQESHVQLGSEKPEVFQLARKINRL